MASHSGGSSLTEFTIKDSGERRSFSSGMVRDTAEGKTNFLSVRFGPMYRRWANHLTKGRVKYPDTAPGTPNWTLAEGIDEYLRAKESAARHFESWLNGERDEDHAAGLYFNVNLAEYVLEVSEARGEPITPGLGAVVQATQPPTTPCTTTFCRLHARARGADADDEYNPACALCREARYHSEHLLDPPTPQGGCAMCQVVWPCAMCQVVWPHSHIPSQKQEDAAIV